MTDAYVSQPGGWETKREALADLVSGGPLAPTQFIHSWHLLPTMSPHGGRDKVAPWDLLQGH